MHQPLSCKPLPQIAALSLKQKIGQLVQIDIPGFEITSETKDHFLNFEYNGVILFAKNVDSRDQVVSLIQDLNELCAIPPMLTVDQEGGLVDRFRFAEMNCSPGAMALAATGDPTWTYQAHLIMATELASLGISLDFAPCLDVNSNPANPIIGARSFGSDPQAVSAHGVAAIRGLQQGGVAACGKHFPGHGDTDMDSHVALPSVKRDKDSIQQIELVPFQAAVAAGIDAIMTAHVTFPALEQTPGLPATLSKRILTGILREELKFEGVIFTDSMAMHAIAKRYGVAEAAVMAIEAGADIILACGPFTDHIKSCQGLLEAVASGRITEERIDQSLGRIFKLKQKYCRLPQPRLGYPILEHHSQMGVICQKSVTVLQGEAYLPLQGRALILIPDLLPQTPLGELNRAVSLKEVMCTLQVDPTLIIDEERYHINASGDSWRNLSQRSTEYDQVIVCLFSRSGLPDSQRMLVENLVRDGVKPILVSLSSPYLFSGLDETLPRILTYNYSPLSLTALANVLLGLAKPTGTCPVTITRAMPL